MKRPRVRFTVRQLMAAVAVAALLAMWGRAWVHPGPRPGRWYYGTYRYLGRDQRWHEVRGNVIFVRGDGAIFVD